MSTVNKIYSAEVLYNEEIAGGIFKLTMLAPEAASAAGAGQFVNVYPEADRLILPRPISICDADPEEGTLVLVYAVVGAGTEELSRKQRGDSVRITSPLGHGFKPVEGIRSAVLCGGGVGNAPMVLLAKTLSGLGIRCTAIAGFKKEPFLIEELRTADCRVIVSTDLPTEEAFLGNVVDCMEINGIQADAYYVCGPRPMLAAVVSYVTKTDENAPLQVSMEERMGCGYGVCVGCVCDTVNGKKKVCKDGPVFDGREVVW